MHKEIVYRNLVVDTRNYDLIDHPIIIVNIRLKREAQRTMKIYIEF